MNRRPRASGGRGERLRHVAGFVVDRGGVEGAEALLGFLRFVLHRLPVAQVPAHRGAGDVAGVQEDVLTPVVGLDKAEAAGGIEKFELALLHSNLPYWVVGAPSVVAAGPGKSRSRRTGAATATQGVFVLDSSHPPTTARFLHAPSHDDFSSSSRLSPPRSTNKLDG